MDQLAIVTLNLAAPSKERARQLLDEWILKSSYDIYVFSETSEGEGTELITSVFKAAGWSVFQRNTLHKDRGVAIATRVKATASSKYPVEESIPSRSVVLDLHTTPRIQVIGLYVPNRGNDFAKLERKKLFLDSWLSHFSLKSEENTLRILIGDLNVVPVNQRPVFLPQHPFEDEWFRKITSIAGLYDAALKHRGRHENTWVAHTGEGYTYDHILPQEDLAARVVNFAYDHSPRASFRISDHSALTLTLSLENIERLHRDPPTEPKQIELF